MSWFRRSALVGVALVVGLVVVREGWAGAPTDLLRVQIERVVKTLEEPDLKRDGKEGSG